MYVINSRGRREKKNNNNNPRSFSQILWNLKGKSERNNNPIKVFQKTSPKDKTHPIIMARIGDKRAKIPPGCCSYVYSHSSSCSSASRNKTREEEKLTSFFPIPPLYFGIFVSLERKMFHFCKFTFSIRPLRQHVFDTQNAK